MQRSARKCLRRWESRPRHCSLRRFMETPLRFARCLSAAPETSVLPMPLRDKVTVPFLKVC